MGLYFGRSSEKEIRESEGVRREIIKGLRVGKNDVDDKVADKIIKKVVNCAHAIGVGNGVMTFLLSAAILCFIGALMMRDGRYFFAGLAWLIPLPLLIISNILYAKKADGELAKAGLDFNKVLDIVELEYKKKEKESFERAEAEELEKTKKRLKYECKDCGTTTKYGSNYCSGCGKKMNWDKLLDKKLQKTSHTEYACDKCDAKIKLGMKYCPGCGGKLNWPEEDE